MAVTRDDVYEVMWPEEVTKYLLGKAHAFDRLYPGWEVPYRRAEAVAIRNANIDKKKQLDLAAQQLTTQQQDLVAQQQAAHRQERLSNEERIRALMRVQSRGAIAGE